MAALLGVSRLIDRVNGFIGRWICWLILFSVLISAGNALVRKLFNVSSNGLLELQWYLFSATFMLAAGYVLLKDEHIRVDVISGRLRRRTRQIIDLVMHVLVLMPFAVTMIWLSWPDAVDAYVTGEMSSNSDGLILWPVKVLIPAGFLLLLLQAVSQTIKLAASLSGHLPPEAVTEPAAGRSAHAGSEGGA